MAAKPDGLLRILLNYAMQLRVDESNWPKPPDGKFEVMSGELRKVVECAVGSVGAYVRDWEWNPYEQVFKFMLHVSVKMGDAPIEVTTRHHFDPRNAWTDETQRLTEHAVTYTNDVRTALTKADA